MINRIHIPHSAKNARRIAALLLALVVSLNLFQAFAESPGQEFTVEILHDGKRSACAVSGGTVQDALLKAGVSVGEYDVVSPIPELRVQGDETVTVTRRELVTREETLEIPFRVIETPTSLLKEGVRKTLSEGRAGSRTTAYSRMFEEGKPIGEEQPLGKPAVTKPLAEWTLVGEPGTAISPLEPDILLDENGIPQQYASVLKGRKAAGYSARQGAGTASGRPAAVGHVAVNPNVIPYGTKLYIRSEDGGFVYGYAIAADTGTALKQGIVDLDLFYGTYAESALNGIRTVDIYILGE